MLAIRGAHVRALAVAWLCIASLLASAYSSPAPSRVTAAAVSAPAGSQFQSDAAHTGVQTGSGITPPLGVRWRTTIPTHPSYAVVGGGHVYVTFNLDPTHEGLLALNESDGSTFFGPVNLGPESSGHYAGLAYDGGRLFTNYSSCLIDAVDATTGAIVWQNQLNESSCGGPVTASNGSVFIPTLGSVTALSELDGHQLWMNTTQGGPAASPAFTGSGVYIGQAAQFTDIDAATGATIWHFNGPTNGGGGRTTPVAGGRVYARRYDVNSGYVLDATNGGQLAAFTSMRVPAVDSTQGYYETDLTTGVNRVDCWNTCRLEAHRLTDQALRWSFDGDGNLDTPPLELDGTVYIGSNTGTIYGVAAASGQSVWSGASPDSSVSPTGGGTDIWPYDEQNASSPPSALGAGDGMLFVTYGQDLFAYQHAAPGTVPAFEYHSTGDNAGTCDGHGTAIDHGCAWPLQQSVAGNDHAKVEIQGSQPTSVSIVNGAGQTVATTSGSGPTIELWATAVPAGSYTLQVRTTDPTVQLHTLFSAYLEVDTPAAPGPTPTPTPTPTPSPTPTPTPTPSPSPGPGPTPAPSVPSWSSLGGSLTSNPEVVAAGPSIDVFVRGTDNGLWQKTWNGTGWGQWTSLGGVATSNPHAVSAGTRIDVFVRGADNGLWQKTWNGTAWSQWTALGGTLTSDPDPVASGSNRVDVFVRGTDNGLWQKTWNGTGWGQWTALGGTLTSNPHAVASGSNRIDVFVRGTDNGLWQSTWNGSAWGTWMPLGGSLTSDPRAVSSSSGTIDVFVRGTDNGLWQRSWTASGWSAWRSLGGVLISESEIASCTAGHIDVFAVGTDRGMWQLGFNGTAWASWTSWGGSWTSNPAALCTVGATSEVVFVRGSDNALWAAMTQAS